MREFWREFLSPDQKPRKGVTLFQGAVIFSTMNSALFLLRPLIPEASAEQPASAPTTELMTSPTAHADEILQSLGIEILTPEAVHAPTGDFDEIPADLDQTLEHPSGQPIGELQQGTEFTPEMIPWHCNVEAFECNEEHVMAAIIYAAREQSVNQLLLECLAEKESHFNPYKISRTDDHGPFQFHINPPNPQRPYRWTMMIITPWAEHSVYEPFGSTNAAAWLIKNDHKYASQGGWTTFPLCARFDFPVNQIALSLFQIIP